MKRSVSKVAFVLAVLTLVGFSTANAGTIGGVVDSINALSSETFESDATGATSLSATGTDVVVAGGVINNNYEDGWKLTVTSEKYGVLSAPRPPGATGPTRRIR